MSIGTILLGLVLIILIVGMTALVLLWAREESANAVGAPFYDRASSGAYYVQLLETGRRKAAVLSLVRRASPVSLRDAYSIVEHPPAIVTDGVSREDAEWLVEQLEAKGARARILGQNDVRRTDDDDDQGSGKRSVPGADRR